jgi:predicted MFS family arabinose efflux permease
VRALFRRREARLLLAGQTLSYLGTRSLWLAMGIWVKTLTGSSAAAGLVFFCYAAAALLAPLAGLWVDRVRKRPLMIGMDLFMAVSVLSLLFVHGRDDIWIIYGVTTLYGLVGLVFTSARSAFLRLMLPQELLGDANAALQTVSESMRIFAPLAGAGLFALVGGGAVAVVDSATFLVSAACLAAIHVPDERPAREEQHLMAEVSAGIRHIFRTDVLRQITVACAIALLVVGFSETLIFAIVDQGLHRPASFVGILMAFQGVGAIAGAVVGARLLRHLGDRLLVAVGLAGFGFAMLVLVIPSMPVDFTAVVIGGASISWLVIAFGTALQLRTPLPLQGRVSSAADLLIGTPQTFSIAFGAALSTVVDFRLLLVTVAGVTGAAGVWLGTRLPERAVHAAPACPTPSSSVQARTASPPPMS